MLLNEMEKESGKKFEYSKKKQGIHSRSYSALANGAGDSIGKHHFHKPVHYLKSANKSNVWAIIIGTIIAVVITTAVFVFTYSTLNIVGREDFTPSNFTINLDPKTDNELSTLRHVRPKRSTLRRKTEADCRKMYESLLTYAPQNGRNKRTKIMTPEFKRECFEGTKNINHGMWRYGSSRMPQAYEPKPKVYQKETNFASYNALNSIKSATNFVMNETSDRVEENIHNPVTIGPLQPEIKETQKSSGRFPPTGPSAQFTTTGDITSTGLSGPGEALKTSQQLSVSLPRVVQQICFLGPKVLPGQGFSSSGVYMGPGQEQLPNYMYPPIQQMGEQTGNLQSFQRIDARESLPSVHVPTAISSPNPYFFPTLSGSPVLVQPTVLKQPTFYVKPVQQYQVNHQSLFYAKPLTNFNSQAHTIPSTPGQTPLFYQPPLQNSIAPGQFYNQPHPSQSYSVNNMSPFQSFGSNHQQIQTSSFYSQQPQQSRPPTAFDPQTGVISFLPPNAQIHPTQTQIESLVQKPVIVQSFPLSGSGPSSNQVYCTYIPQPDAPMQTYTFPAVQGVSEYKETPPSAEYEMFKSYDKQDSNTTVDGSTMAKSVPDGASCGANMIPCSDGVCIQKTDWCDGKINCIDLSDEANCMCPQRISKNKHCDGFYDCPNGEDELECSGCGPEQFFCEDWTNRSPTCIPLEKRCDNNDDCPNGKDEKGCTVLTEIINQNNKFVMIYGKGFLLKNFLGRWYPVCAGQYNMDLAYQACTEEYGHLLSEPRISASKPVGTYSRGIILNAFNRWAFLPRCNPELITTVDCGEMLCGTRMFNDGLYEMNIFRRHKRLDSSLWNTRAANEPYESALAYGAETNKISNNNWPFSDSSQFNTNLDQLNGINNAGLWGRKESDSIIDSGTKKRSEGRVVGGTKSKAGTWPWLIALYRDGGFHCGGVIINRMWILTAAHCVDNFQKYFFEVQAGVLRRLSYSPQEQSRKVVHVILNEDYNREDMRNDIALLHLAEPLKFNKWVRPICLPDPRCRKLPIPGDACVAVGWGATYEQGPDPDHMREVQVPVLDSCKHRADIIGDEVCAGELEGGVDTCQGDSGGPLLCKIHGFTDRWYVAGLVSHGEGCGRPQEPGVYTRVYNYFSWIEKNIKMRKASADHPVLECPGTKCKGGRCISNVQTCDGVSDCLGMDDELLCTSEEGRDAIGNTAHNITSSKSSMASPKSVENNLVADSLISEPLNATVQSNGTTSEPSQADKKMNTSLITIPLGSNFKYEIITSFFTCKERSQEILISRRCDGIIDCEDGTDERDCTCRDRVKSLMPHLICNGKVQCRDGCDEKQCLEKCPANKFYCPTSRKCLNKEVRCNGINECGYNEDEIDCFALVEKIPNLEMDSAGRPKLNANGIAMEYNIEHDEWLPVCFDAKSPAPTALEICLSLGYMGYNSLEVVEIEKNNTYDYCTPQYRSGDTGSCTREIGLKVQCSWVKNPEGDTGWPWNAFLYKDGELFSTAVLVTTSWLVVSQSTIAGINFTTDYIVAALGVTEIGIGLLGPYDQFIHVDGFNIVEATKTALLHLSKPALLSHQVKPIEIPEMELVPRSDEECHIQILGKNKSLVDVSLDSTQNCDLGKRCFKIADPKWCEAKRKDIGGGIVCQSSYGMYLTSIFSDLNEFCNHPGEFTSFTSISDYHEIMKAEVDKEMKEVFERVECATVRCETGRCLNWSNIMDNIQDCLDSRDESLILLHKKINYCSQHSCTCPLGMIKCKRKGNCIPSSSLCDGVADCDDSSDEVNCSPSGTCATYLNMTRPQALCDGVPHCYDRSDEAWKLCSQSSCSLNSSFSCTPSKGCIPEVFVCDGVKDCPNGEDEVACVAIESPLNKLSEGRLMTRTYGKWSPHCFSEPMTKKEVDKLCSMRGYESTRAVTYTDVLEKSIVLDVFNKLRLNEQTSIALRSYNRPFLHKESYVNCTTVYIECLD